MYKSLLFVIISCWTFLAAETPSALYLTWMHDPTTTMTIQWHTSSKEKHSRITYSKDQAHWIRCTGSAEPVPGVPLLVHTVELADLLPDTLYTFRIRGESETYTFRTLPARLNRSVRFVIGGDAYYYLYLFRKMNDQIAALDPDFVVIGGDIAYTVGHSTPFKGKNWEMRRWQTFLRTWKEQMRTTDGRLIPLLPLLGNHDIRKNSKKAPLFFTFFAFAEPQKAYRAIDAGDYLSLILLDTGHYSSIQGPQTEWLEATLAQRACATKKPLILPVYHIGAYPSFYPYEGPTPKKIRNCWVPLFEQYGVRAAFEHHNHAYKRTHPLRAGSIDPTGIIYLGDGAWGIAPRRPLPPSKCPYLAKSARINAVWTVTLQPESYTLKSINIEGNPIDEIHLKMTN